jgi:hypothetical protein
MRTLVLIFRSQSRKANTLLHGHRYCPGGTQNNKANLLGPQQQYNDGSNVLLIIVLHGIISSEGFLLIPSSKSNDVLLLAVAFCRYTSKFIEISAHWSLTLQYVASFAD